VTGNLTLVASTPTAGNILKGGAPFIHNFGTDSTFLGINAGNLSGAGGGGANTGLGKFALGALNGGAHNTAVGNDAMRSTSNGQRNTAVGLASLYTNTGGNDNTAIGMEALYYATGSTNTALGSYAAFWNSSGSNNTALGQAALTNNTTGSSNIAIGAGAGGNQIAGDNNILIGNVGVTNESGAIRLGAAGTHTKAFVAGIYNTTGNGLPVVVDANGQLGTTQFIGQPGPVGPGIGTGGASRREDRQPEALALSETARCVRWRTDCRRTRT